MTQENGNPDASVQEGDVLASIEQEISNDDSFQEELAELSQEEADEKINEKRRELTNKKFESLAEKAKKDKELVENYKIRAEKAEKAKKGDKPKNTEEQPKELSSMDTIALVNAKVHKDDIPEVIEYARFKGVDIQEALESSYITSLLSENSEKRSTAEATVTGSMRRGSTQISGEDLLKKAEKGEELSDDQLEALAEARMQRKLDKLNKNKKN